MTFVSEGSHDGCVSIIGQRGLCTQAYITWLPEKNWSRCLTNEKADRYLYHSVVKVNLSRKSGMEKNVHASLLPFLIARYCTAPGADTVCSTILKQTSSK